MAIKLVLSREEILNKVFKIVPRGYDALEVDIFLDRVMKDYAKVEANVLMEAKEIDALNEEIASLKAKNQKLEIELEKCQARLKGIKESDNVTTDNMDLLKRINTLELFLYHHGYPPENIK